MPVYRLLEQAMTLFRVLDAGYGDPNSTSNLQQLFLPSRLSSPKCARLTRACGLDNPERASGSRAPVLVGGVAEGVAAHLQTH